MVLAQKLLLIGLIVSSINASAHYRFDPSYGNTAPSTTTDSSLSSNQLPTDDNQLIADVSAQQNANFVAAANLVVTQLLADQHSDVSGLTHQRWIARMTNGSTVMIVYNLDMGQHVPVQVGDSFDVAGQFIWTNGYGLVHWTHIDPEHRRPDGYVYFNGTFYGSTGSGN